MEFVFVHFFRQTTERNNINKQQQYEKREASQNVNIVNFLRHNKL